MSKNKKNKKEKKRKKSNKSYNKESDEEVTWEENVPPSSMNDRVHNFEKVEDFLDSMTYSKAKKMNRDGERNKLIEEAKKRELNPFFLNGGSGLPIEQKQTVSDNNNPTCLLNSSNYNWIKKSYDRCFEQANYQNTSVFNILITRYGEAHSLELIKEFSPQLIKKFTRELTRSIEKTPATKRIPIETNISGEERHVSDADLNEMAAKLIKAEFSQNTAKIKKIQTNLNRLREAKNRGIKIRIKNKKRQHSEIGTANVKEAQNIHGDFDYDGRGIYSKKMKFKTHDNSGNRIAYTENDVIDKSINDLIREEHLCSNEQEKMTFVNLAGKKKAYFNDDDDDEPCKTRLNTYRVDAVLDYKSKSYADKNCQFCIERLPKYLVVYTDEKIFISLPDVTCLADLQCIISPYEHIGSLNRLDEDTKKNLINIKKKIVELFDAKLGLCCIFMEFANVAQNFKHHAHIECIPVDKELVGELQMYFKKSLMELGSEWDQNRRVLKLDGNLKGATGTIPPNFAYFSVEFGEEGGFAKVIDNPNEFHSYFGRGVIGGAIDKEPKYWRNPHKEEFSVLCDKVTHFESIWES